jgi:hypothetical protein
MRFLSASIYHYHSTPAEVGQMLNGPLDGYSADFRLYAIEDDVA